VHTSGLIVCQVWLTSAAPDAPAFATSLFVSSANFGTVCGTTLSGWLFAAAAVSLLVARWLWPSADSLLCNSGRAG